MSKLSKDCVVSKLSHRENGIHNQTKNKHNICNMYTVLQYKRLFQRYCGPHEKAIQTTNTIIFVCMFLISPGVWSVCLRLPRPLEECEESRVTTWWANRLGASQQGARPPDDILSRSTITMPTRTSHPLPRLLLPAMRYSQSSLCPASAPPTRVRSIW